MEAYSILFIWIIKFSATDSDSTTVFKSRPEMKESSILASLGHDVAGIAQNHTAIIYREIRICLSARVDEENLAVSFIITNSTYSGVQYEIINTEQFCMGRTEGLQRNEWRLRPGGFFISAQAMCLEDFGTSVGKVCVPLKNCWESLPRWSMYGIFTNIGPNVGQYSSTMEHIWDLYKHIYMFVHLHVMVLSDVYKHYKHDNYRSVTSRVVPFSDIGLLKRNWTPCLTLQFLGLAKESSWKAHW